MRPSFEWPTARHAADSRMFSNIREFGCSIINVAGDGRPDFSYSIGLYASFGHPEILVVGLDSERAMSLINLAGERIAEGTAFEDGAVSDHLVRALAVAFVAVDRAHYADRVGIARWFYGALGPDAFPVLQLVWPDRNGLFPWAQDFDPALRAMQPVLSAIV